MGELQILQEGAREFEVELSENQVSLFGRFLEELYSWNRRMNLTGISEIGHFKILVCEIIP